MHFLPFIHFVCFDCMIFRVEVACTKSQYYSIYQYKTISHLSKIVLNFYFCELN